MYRDRLTGPIQMCGDSDARWRLDVVRWRRHELVTGLAGETVVVSSYQLRSSRHVIGVFNSSRHRQNIPQRMLRGLWELEYMKYV